MTVKSLTINGKEHPLKYRYLPVSLVDKIKSMNINNQSVWERGTFYKDALKIVKKNLLFGLGANSWRYEYSKVQSYEYSAAEIHSYPLQVMMDYGIVAVVVLLAIIVFIVRDTMICTDKEGFGLIVSILLLLAHSFVDFDMSFFFIMLVFFCLLGILFSKREDYINKKDFIKWKKN